MKIKKMVIKILLGVFLGSMFCISLLPFAWTLFSSFKTPEEIFESALKLPGSINFKNYIDAFERAPIVQYYFNSIIVATVSTILILIFFGMGAYVFARCEFKGRDIIFNVISLSLLVPVTAIIFPIYLTIKNMGLYDSKAGLILVYMAVNLPVSLYIMKSFYITFPKDIENSAYIDGASFLRTYTSIVIPISKPALSATAVLAFITTWNDFFYAFILTTGNKSRTIPIALQYFLSMFGSNYGELFAGCSLVLLPSIIIYLLLHEKIETGLIAGSVKG